MHGRKAIIVAWLEVACDMLDQALDMFLDMYEVETKQQSGKDR